MTTNGCVGSSRQRLRGLVEAEERTRAALPGCGATMCGHCGVTRIETNVGLPGCMRYKENNERGLPGYKVTKIRWVVGLPG